MANRVELLVEEFENGITVKWRDLEKDGDCTKMIASEEEKFHAIGREIWGDIENLFKNSNNDRVRLTIQYELLED